MVGHSAILSGCSGREAGHGSVVRGHENAAGGGADATEDGLGREREFLLLLAVGEAEHMEAEGETLHFLVLVFVSHGDADQDFVAGDSEVAMTRIAATSSGLARNDATGREGQAPGWGELGEAMMRSDAVDHASSSGRGMPCLMSFKAMSSMPNFGRGLPAAWRSVEYMLPIVR